MSDARRAVWSAGVCVLAALLGSRTGSAAAQPAAAEVDVNACRACHEPAVKTLEATRHFGVTQRCEACHKNSPDHLKAATEKGARGPIVSFNKQPTQVVNDACESCHDKGKPAQYQGGPHDRRGVACTACHSVHGYKSEKGLFKAAREPETCFGCHPALRAKMN